MHDELAHGALELLERHFTALNAGDRAAFRDTAYLFDGVPFERWWDGMRSLAPWSVALALRRVDDRVATGHEPHVAIWVKVDARSAATGRRYADDFVVWYLLGSKQWKLGCRFHWWLQPTS